MVRAATLGGVAAVFGAVVILRWQEGYSNVDDYLYAAQTRAYFDALPDPRDLVDAWRAHGSNAPACPRSRCRSPPSDRRRTGSW
jgi:hypothetical protein